MAALVPQTPNLPRPVSAGDVKGLYKFCVFLVARLFAILSEYAQRLNVAVTNDGPIPHVIYTVATVPDATIYEGSTIYVSDETGGATMAFSDGTDWRRVQDRAVVS